MINKINIRINRSRAKYAITLAKSLSPDDRTTLNKVWELCGFKSKNEFEESFKTIMELLLKTTLISCNQL